MTAAGSRPTITLAGIVGVAMAVMPVAVAAAPRPVVMAWWKPNYATNSPHVIWQALYRPRKWDDGDTMSVTGAHWTTWTRRVARARVRVRVAGDTGSGTVVLSHPGLCRAIHGRAFLRMRTSGGPWGRGFTESLAGKCAESTTAASERTLGSAAFRRHVGGEGIGMVRPEQLHAGGFPIFQHLHWRSWGGAVAMASGQNMPDGPFAPSPVQVRAYDFGWCDGHRTYRRVTARQKVDGRWRRWSALDPRGVRAGSGSVGGRFCLSIQQP